MDPADFTAVREAVRRLVREDVVPREDEIEETDAIPQDIRRKAVDMGLFGYTLPEEHGGLGADLTEDVQLAFEFGYTTPAFRSMFGTNNGIAGKVLVSAGTREQRDRWLPRLAHAARSRRSRSPRRRRDRTRPDSPPARYATATTTSSPEPSASSPTRRSPTCSSSSPARARSRTAPRASPSSSSRRTVRESRSAPRTTRRPGRLDGRGLPRRRTGRQGRAHRRRGGRRLR